MAKKKLKFLFLGIGITIIFVLLLIITNIEYKNIKSCHIISDNKILVYEKNLIINQSNLVKGIMQGESMIPSIFPNQKLLFTTNININTLCVGDIIVFNNTLSKCKRLMKSPTDLIIHRIIERHFDKNGIYFITKGDNNYINDDCKIRNKYINSVMIGLIY